MTMTMQSKDRPAVPFRVCGQPCHALKSFIRKSPIRPWSGHGDGGSDCRPFCKLGPWPDQHRSVSASVCWPVARPTEPERSGSNTFHRRAAQDLFARNLGRMPHSPITQRRGRRLVALDRQRWDSGPLVTHMGPTRLSQWAFPALLPPGSRPQRRQGRGTPCEVTATHEPQTPPSLSLRLRTPLVVIHKCILPPFLNHQFPSVSLH